MNLPNKLTIARVIMIPLFLICLYLNIGCGKYIAVGIFILASLTDLLDGKIARKYNLVTNFGKFMDPLADKLLVCSALIALVDLSRTAADFCAMFSRDCKTAPQLQCKIHLGLR